ncbi:MAG: hypothetical protein Nkreftii_002746 [Candidatus Nitrospira kreftii]|uniref:Insertion element IS150 protein InsJ-like helix-turn-helix domain-containing protein n=1 Tax=Candidatus Nitrospira kreftii TaxID=2652173 RepID=A0A7S8FFS2_9BACT|nr:MAG: hypothetical protein Nkreftii_002746 [Candidatus Nitrospira kreftii]
MYALLNTELAEDRKRQYVRVLQAVGNSILFSANELRERDRYLVQGQKKVAAEVVATNSVYSPNPKKVLDDLLKELKREELVIQTQLDDAKARKSKAEKKISSSEPQKAELRKERDKAEETLNNYRNELSALEATHHVLMTQVSEQDKTRWKEAWQTDVSKLEEFFLDTDSLKHKLVSARDSSAPRFSWTHHWGILSPSLMEVFMAKSKTERGRFSSRKKMEVVLRVLRGDDLDVVSREAGITAATVSEWRDQFVASGQAGLKSRAAEGRDDELVRLKALVGDLTMRLELSREAVQRLRGGVPLATGRSTR